MGGAAGVVGDLHVAALRAFLRFELDEHTRLADRIEAEGSTGEMGSLFLGAVEEAAKRRFGESYVKADVIRFVASMRARTSPEVGSVGVAAVECLLEGMLGNADAWEAISEDEMRHSGLVLYALVDEERLDSAGLDHFLECARVRAEQING